MSTVGVTTIIVGIGDIKMGKEPAIIRTSLGSCIGVCLYNSQQKVGAMLHCMLPTAGDNRQKPDFRAAKYADSGLELMVADLKKNYGIGTNQLTAKIFGGAAMLKAISMNIGQNNEDSVRAVLKSFNIPIAAAKTGGDKGYQIDFDLAKGTVICRIFGQDPQEF